MTYITSDCHSNFSRYTVFNAMTKLTEDDEMFFLGGIQKSDVLSAFDAHIFFDDQDVHLDPASEVVPSAKVLYKQ